MWNRKRRIRGFTLLEIVISLGLIATALLAVFRLQAQNLDLQSEATFVTVATQLARDRISRIHAKRPIEAGTFSGDFEPDFPRFTYQEEVSEVPNLDGFFRAGVVITLEDGGRRRAFSVVTYIYEEIL
jgi:prepilin-type N-terminal cleavage/methylation domain-containing protein